MIHCTKESAPSLLFGTLALSVGSVFALKSLSHTITLLKKGITEKKPWRKYLPHLFETLGWIALSSFSLYGAHELFKPLQQPLSINPKVNFDPINQKVDAFAQTLFNQSEEKGSLNDFCLSYIESAFSKHIELSTYADLPFASSFAFRLKQRLVEEQTHLQHSLDEISSPILNTLNEAQDHLKKDEVLKGITMNHEWICLSPLSIFDKKNCNQLHQITKLRKKFASFQNEVNRYLESALSDESLRRCSEAHQLRFLHPIDSSIDPLSQKAKGSYFI